MRSLCGVFSVCCVLAWATTVEAQGSGSCAPTGFEDLGAHYQNVRGVNFLPTYDSMYGQIPAEGSAGFCDVASSTAMWHHYGEDLLNNPGGGPVRASVSAQLDQLKDMGVNTIRVWMSFPYWVSQTTITQSSGVRTYDSSNFTYVLDDFASLCNSKQIYVIPVLWDSLDLSPVRDITTGERIGTDLLDPAPAVSICKGANGEQLAITEYDNMNHWHPNPGFNNLPDPIQPPASSNLVALQRADYSEYVRSCMTGFDAYAGIVLAYDAWNEPSLESAGCAALLLETLYVLKNFVPTNTAFTCYPPKTTVGGTVGEGAQGSRALVQHPYIDIIGVHAYFQTEDAFKGLLFDAMFHSGGAYGKDIILTEGGNPGAGYSYSDFISFAREAPRVDLPPVNGQLTTGIGFMPWVSHIGSCRGNYPLTDWTGIFYSNGSVRDGKDAAAFVEAALAAPSSGFVEADLYDTDGDGLGKSLTVHPNGYGVFNLDPSLIGLQNLRNWLSAVIEDGGASTLPNAQWRDLQNALKAISGRTIVPFHFAAGDGHLFSFLALDTDPPFASQNVESSVSRRLRIFTGLEAVGAAISDPTTTPAILTELMTDLLAELEEYSNEGGGTQRDYGQADIDYSDIALMNIWLNEMLDEWAILVVNLIDHQHGGPNMAPPVVNVPMGSSVADPNCVSPAP